MALVAAAITKGAESDRSCSPDSTTPHPFRHRQSFGTYDMGSKSTSH